MRFDLGTTRSLHDFPSRRIATELDEKCSPLIATFRLVLVKLNSGNDERHDQRVQPTAARRVMQRSEDVFVLVSSIVCVRARLLCIAWLENCFVDVVTRVHGHGMFAECLPVRPRSLLLHRPVFHCRCCYFPGIWYWAATVWAVRVEMDW
jgi:hypothetical protein